MPRFLPFLALLLASQISHGAAYKCKDANGKTVYSDTACSGQNAESIHVQKSAPPPSQSEVVQKCFDLQMTLNGHLYKDPTSAHLEGSYVNWVSVEGVGARQLITVLINAKNSYGAYAGSKPSECLWMPDGRVLDKSGFVVH
jgi:hypothetical protein